MNAKLTIGCSYSRIEGLNVEQIKQLRELLSYNVDPQVAYFAGGNYPTKRYCIDKKGVFATGLLFRVLDYLRHQPEYNYTVKFLSNAPAKRKLIPVKGNPYTWQHKAVTSAASNERGIISAVTGSGKSYAIAMLAAKYKTLIVVPTLELKKQLTSTLSEVLEDTSRVVVENIDSRRLKELTDFDCLIIDECHHAAAKTYQKLNKTAWKNIYYRFCFTATPFRNNSEETLLFEGICGSVIFNYGYHDAVKDNIIVPIKAFYIEVPKIKTDAYSWKEVYSELVVNNQHKNMKIAQLIATLRGGSVMTLVKEIAHGNILSSLATGTVFANGQDEKSREFIKKFSNDEIRSLIGTTGVLGEGVDTKPCEYVIIAGLGKAKSSFMQNCGRTMRKFGDKMCGKIILIKDPSHKFTLKHFKEQCKILKEEYGVIPEKWEV